LVVAVMPRKPSLEAGGLSLGVVTILAFVIVATSPLFGRSPDLAAVDSKHDSRAASNPIEVFVTISGNPHVGAATQGLVEVVPRWQNVSDVSIGIEVPSGVELTSNTPDRRHVLRSERFRFPFEVVPRTAGLHEIAVRVTGLSATFGPLGGVGRAYLEVPSGSEGPRPFGNPLAHDARGSVAATTGPPGEGHRIPPVRGASPGVGPAPDPRPRSRDLVGADTGGGPIIRSHATFVVTGQWNYWQEDDVTLAPQRWARVEVRDDDGLGLFDLLWVGSTGADGTFSSAAIDRVEPDCCGRGNQDVYVVFFASNGGVSVQTTLGVPYSWETTVTTIGAEDVFDVGSLGSGSNQFAQRPFQYINDGWDFAVNLGGLGGVLGQVRVFIPDSCTFYTVADDTIHLCADGVDDKSPDDVNHEYGHYVQDKLYNDAFFPSPGGAHSFCEDNQDRGLAWAEGFADFFGARVQTEIVDPSDVSYSRPWDGSLFRIDMETRTCPAGVLGDDQEMHVAWSLWDLRDGADDGADLGISHSLATLMSAIDGCDQGNYREYYDGGACNWISRGNPRFAFLATAGNNRIDYNEAPTAAVTTQTSFAWIRGSMTIAATASDPDTPVRQVVFRISTDNVCTDMDALVGVDSASPYTVSFDTRAIPDTGTGWACAVASDVVEAGAYAVSSAFVGIDNTPPTTTPSLAGTVGGGGWYTSPVEISLTASDALSGLSGIQVRIDGGPWADYTVPLSLSADGTHIVAYSARDVVGNAEATGVVTVNVDRTPPSATVIEPRQDQIVTDTRVLVKWDSVDNHSGAQSCSLAIDRAAVGSALPPSGQLPTNLTDGPHEVRLACEDIAGNVAESSVSFRVDTSLPSLLGSFTLWLLVALSIGIGIAIAVALVAWRRRRGRAPR